MSRARRERRNWKIVRTSSKDAEEESGLGPNVRGTKKLSREEAFDAAVARLLGMTRRTLAYRIAIYNLEPELAALESIASRPGHGGLRPLARVRPAAAHFFASGA
jgi:hypothetical protein